MMRIFAFALMALPLLASCSPAETPEKNASQQMPVAANAAPPPPAAHAAPYNPTAVTGMARIDDKAFFLTPAKWPSNTVPVCWNSAAEAARPEAAWVKDSVTSTWQAASALRFIGWGTCASNARGIRITVEDVGPHTNGLGKQLDGAKNGMILNRTFGAWGPDCAVSEAERESCIRSIGVHEFGHAIGFAHEQNSPDTPGECREPKQGSQGDVMLTPWDIHSVMNYCNPVYNNDGKLSDYDRQAVAKVYK